jgi:hypothetical protein
MKRRTIAIVTGLAACMFVSAAHADVYVYPKPGQSQESFESDQYACHNWAAQQSGFNPSAPPPAAGAPPPQQGGAVKGAARGAAVGAVGGAIAGDAGKGAAIGAAVGGTGGAMRQNRQNRESAAASQQAQAQQQAGYANYEKAYATCLSGRGDSVK